MPGSLVRGDRQIRGVTRGAEGVASGVTLFSDGRQRVTRWRIQDPTDFCRKTRTVFGAEVYWKSTGDSGLGKSAGKEHHLGSVVFPRREQYQRLYFVQGQHGRRVVAMLRCIPRGVVRAGPTW